MKDKILIPLVVCASILLFSGAAILFVHSDDRRYKDDPLVRAKVEEVAKRFAEDAMRLDNVRCTHLRDDVYVCLILNPPTTPVRILCNTESCDL